MNVLTNDSDTNDPLTVTVVRAPANGAATINADDTVTYDPDGCFVGQDTFTYTVSDGKGRSGNSFPPSSPEDAGRTRNSVKRELVITWINPEDGHGERPAEEISGSTYRLATHGPDFGLSWLRALDQPRAPAMDVPHCGPLC